MNEFNEWLDEVAKRGASLLTGVRALDDLVCSNTHFNHGEYTKTVNEVKFVLQSGDSNKLVIPTRSRFVRGKCKYLDSYDVFPNESKVQITLVAVDCKTC